MAEEMHEMANLLLQSGASVNVADNDGKTLLHSSLMDGNETAALFLINNGADINLQTKANETCVELAIRKKMTSVVESLCKLGADTSSSSGQDPPLWMALEIDQDLASVLVRYGVDTDAWSEDPEGDGYHHTLLHRAINDNNEEFACFLIRCGCDLNRYVELRS